MAEDADLWLFSYGTLRQPEVQTANFGRLLEGRADALVGFALSWIEITDAEVVALSGSDRHPLVTATGNLADTVEGIAFKVTEAEIAAADAYEVDDYVRVETVLASGVTAFVYVNRAAA